mgnify:FL=1
MSNKNLINLDINTKNTVVLDRNGCKIILFFTKKNNPMIEDNILNMLVDCFENRMKFQTC